MRPSSTRLAIVLTSMLYAGSAIAQAPAAASPGGAPAAAPPTAASGEDKRIGVGVDGQFVLPLGDMRDGTGPQIGALVRAGYRVTPPLELTARLGYLAGLSKEQPPNALLGTIKTSISNIPIWLGGR